MDINGIMCGGIDGRNSKDDFASDYDSDETVIDDSSLGSDDENDQLQLKSLFFNKDDTRTPAKLCHFGNEMLVHLSPEIQHLSKLEHNKQAKTTDVSMEEVCESQMHEGQSPSLIRGWFHNPGFGSQETLNDVPLPAREHTCCQSAEGSANPKSSLIKYKSQELEDDNSVTFSKNTSGQRESPFSGSESDGDNNSNPNLIQSKRRKSSDPQCNRLTSKRSSSSEKEISSRITKRFKKSLNLLHNEPSCHSETPNRKPAESSATKTGSIADYKSKVLRRQVFEKNHYGETSLHRAAKQKDVDLLYRLIKIGAEVNRADNAGWTPLHEACVFGNYNAAKCLLEAGADVNATGFGQVAPIHDAVYEGDYEMAKLLLEHGANPHLVTEIGKSAFDYIEDVNIRNLLLLFDSKKSSPSLHMDVTSRQPTIIATTEREDRGTDGNGAVVDIGNACNKNDKIKALLKIMVKCNLVKWSKESIDTGQSYKMYNNPDLPSPISTEISTGLRDDSIVPQDICLDSLHRPYKHYSIRPCKVPSRLLHTDVSKIVLRVSTAHFKSTDSDRPQKDDSINLHRAYSIRPYRDSCDMLLHTSLSKSPKCPSSHLTRSPSNILALRLPNTPQKQSSTILPISSSRMPLRMHSKI